jgi:hypothetical protein
LLAALGTGLFKNKNDICQHIQFNQKVVPNPVHTAQYRPYLKHYTELYRQTKNLMHEL